MASTDLRAKFNEWIMIFVMVPAAIGVGVCMIFLWRSVLAAHASPLNEMATSVSAQFEQILRTESIRLKTIAYLPYTTSLLGMADRRYYLRQHSQSEKLEDAWAASARDDMIVRGVMDNDLGYSFRLVCDQQPHITSILFTDHVGALLASSDQRPHYYQDLDEWWQFARAKSRGRAASEGMSKKGLIGLNYARWKPTSSNSLHGVLREELKLSQMVQQISITGLQENHMVFMIGIEPIQIAGATNLFDAASPVIADEIKVHGAMRGWQKGCSYIARNIDADIIWEHPLLLVTARGEDMIPPSVYGPIAGGLLVGVLAVVGVFAVARATGRKLFFDPMREAAEAGVWILHKAFGDKEASARYAREHPWVKIGAQEAAPVQKELAQWMSGVQLNVEKQAAILSQSDLNLAMDLQRTMLSRPHPVVPAMPTEGQLSLEFHHRFRPSRVVGSDFFSMGALDPDRADVFIADVVDHGTRGALVASILRALLDDIRGQGRSPVDFLVELNRKFCETLSNLPARFFATACYFVADTTSRVATCALAGLPAPFVLHRSQGRVTRMLSHLARGAALGVLTDEQYLSEEAKLEAGDLFFFFTNGLVEACDRNGDRFGMMRLEFILHAQIQTKSAGEILDAVMNEVIAFMSNQPIVDDICLVAVDVTSTAIKKNEMEAAKPAV